MRIVIYADDGQLVTSSEFPSPLDGAEVASSVQSDLRLAAQIRNLALEEAACIADDMDYGMGDLAAAIRAAKEQG